VGQQNPLSVKLEKIPGVGPLTASAFVATIGSALEFKSGEHYRLLLGWYPGSIPAEASPLFW
jgi:transposase